MAQPPLSDSLSSISWHHSVSQDSINGVSRLAFRVNFAEEGMRDSNKNLHARESGELFGNVFELWHE
jgi:hypothetical protein